MSIWGQIVSEIVAQSTQKKIRRVCMEFSEYNWATISETICRVIAQEDTQLHWPTQMLLSVLVYNSVDLLRVLQSLEGIPHWLAHVQG